MHLPLGSTGSSRNASGPEVDAVSGLTLESAWLTPLAIVALVIVALTTGLTIGTVGASHTVLLLLSGAITAGPLMLFSSAARRLPLVYLGFIQYLAPIIQFILGVFVLNEPMPIERWIGFSLVWIALIVLTVDLLRTARRVRARQPRFLPERTSSLAVGERA